MVLVYGAAGLLGQEICRRLRKEGGRVRALLNRNTSPATFETLKRLNVDTFVADLSECAAIAAACKDAEAVICADPAMMPSRNGPPLDAAGVRCLVELASVLGVRRFVYVTVPEHFATPCALVSARAEACARLQAHSMDYVILETGFFMETWLTPELGFDHHNGKATVFGEGSQQLAWVSCEDVAELAVRSLKLDRQHKHRIRVAAPGNVSPFDLIRIFEELRGSAIEVTRVAEADLRATHKTTADPGDRVLAAMKVQYAHGLPLRANLDEMPMAMSSVRDYAARHWSREQYESARGIL